MRVLIIGRGYVSRKMQIALLKHDIQPEVYAGGRIDCYSGGFATSVGNPDLLINCAGYTGYPNVDDCEDHPRETFLANSYLPAFLGQFCRGGQIPLIHFSTGCIFQGDRFFNEADEPNNLNTIYTLSKYVGEKLINWDKSYILRIRMPISIDFSPKNLLTKLAGYPKIIDAVNSITWLEEACETAVKLWLRGAPFGTYNLTCRGSITTKEIIESLQLKKDFFDSKEEFQSTVKAPRSFTTLSTEKLISLGFFPTSAHNALQKVLFGRKLL
jgi:UDP-glucose 4,6-dehydratase